jgi:hypothetical protein
MFLDNDHKSQSPVDQAYLSLHGDDDDENRDSVAKARELIQMAGAKADSSQRVVGMTPYFKEDENSFVSGEYTS